MSNIEKIKAEIERRKKICEGIFGIFERESDTYYQGKAVAYGELLSFVNSLPEEKPSEDLEEAAENCVWKSIDSNDPTLVPKFIPLLLSLFISGAYWQKEQMTKEAVNYKIVNNLAAYPVIYYEVKHLGLKFGDKVKLIIVKED